MGSKVWRLVPLQAWGTRSGQAPGQPSLASSSRTGAANTLRSPPLCSSTAGTGTGIWQLRPRRTYRAGTRAWPPASAPSPPAPWVAQAGPRPSIQGLAGGPPLRPCEGGTAQDCPPRPSHMGSTSLNSQKGLQMGTFCLTCFSFASSLLSGGEESPPRQGCTSEGTRARPRTGPTTQRPGKVQGHTT